MVGPRSGAWVRGEAQDGDNVRGLVYFLFVSAAAVILSLGCKLVQARHDLRAAQEYSDAR